MIISLCVYIRQQFHSYRTEMTFTPPDSLAGSVDLDTTDLEVNFERRVANCVAKHVKKVACMFWTVIILLVANVTEEHITKQELTIRLKEEMNKASFGMLSAMALVFAIYPQ